MKIHLQFARWIAAAATLALGITACSQNSSNSNAASANAAAGEPAAVAAQQANGAADALPADKTGGFDGARAYEYTAKLVSFGPRPVNSDAIHHTQDYIRDELKKNGCTFDEDDFNASTPIGTLPMKNIIVKIPGTSNNIILLLTHYDTVRIDNFVGAADGGSSTGLMLEMSRLLCPKKQPLAVWIAFLDGEEAQVVVDGQAQWTDTDSVYGSRELAARMALSGDLNHVKAVILADLVGQKDLKIRKDSLSTGWLTNLVWSKANTLGYSQFFLSSERPMDDDHGPFLKRHVASVDIIDCCSEDGDYPYWHTTQDTMDKLSAKNLGIVGHVILATVDDLESRPTARDKTHP
jgi:glutaminyl-peptide cyclotransferase